MVFAYTARPHRQLQLRPRARAAFAAIYHHNPDRSRTVNQGIFMATYIDTIIVTITTYIGSVFKVCICAGVPRNRCDSFELSLLSIHYIVNPSISYRITDILSFKVGKFFLYIDRT